MKAVITVLGMVQGVGFRPFVAGLAESMDICGSVRNSGGIVIIECDAETGVLGEFVRRLRFLAPRGARVLDVRVTEQHEDNMAGSQERQPAEKGFRIVESDVQSADIIPILPPDIGLCPDCRRELLSVSDRRYGYPYISCTLCGPRYSIMEKLPYDRGNITMRRFPMCSACSKEYSDSGSRRRHAQTISCHECGPQLLITETGKKTDMREQPEDPGDVHDTRLRLQRCVDILMDGGVLAVKGIGGYQLCCRADRPEAVRRIRVLKQREKKPFAVMFADAGQVREYCELSAAEEKLLESAAAPIVLLKRKKEFDAAVCGESREIGAFLPYTGLHLLLLQACGPLVMTSANITSEPIITSDIRMRELAASAGDNKNGCIDAVAWNRREILRPLDDSLCRVVGDDVIFLRRSRGYVPLPLPLYTGQIREEDAGTDTDAVLACGGDLKAVSALSVSGRAYLSQYFGDLEHYAVKEVYEAGTADMQKLLGIRPKYIVCDRHPGYISHRYAEREALRMKIPLLQVQHHHAHAASVMAENKLTHCIGVAMDGTGYGTDGAVWGCEFMLCRDAGFRRMGHLEYCELIGADDAARDAARTAAVQLLQMTGRDAQCDAVVRKLLYGRQERKGCAGKPSGQESILQAALKNHINISESSSMGRLFDTVSALTGVRYYNGYEGECASALENKAMEHQASEAAPLLLFPVKERSENGVNMLIAGRFTIIGQIIERLGEGCSAAELAAAFHEAVARMILEMCERIRSETGEREVTLSGGVFANMLLLSRTTALLRGSGFSVNINRSVPSNDGGIAYGQAWIAQQYIKNAQSLPDGFEL